MAEGLSRSLSRARYRLLLSRGVDPAPELRQMGCQWEQETHLVDSQLEMCLCLPSGPRSSIRGAAAQMTLYLQDAAPPVGSAAVYSPFPHGYLERPRRHLGEMVTVATSASAPCGPPMLRYGLLVQQKHVGRCSRLGYAKGLGVPQQLPGLFDEAESPRCVCQLDRASSSPCHKCT